ncbi:MAG: hypothetical protein D6709_11860, partial [Chloroflexi bacterium]
PALGRFADAWDEKPIVLLEFRLSDGIIALGEVGRGPTIAELRPWLEQLIGYRLRGLDLGVLPETLRSGYRWGLLTSPPQRSTTRPRR